MNKRITRLPRATFKSVMKLTQKKYRKSERQFIIEGSRLVEEALKSDWSVRMLLVSRSNLEKGEGAKVFQAAEAKDIPVYEISEEEVGKLSDTVTSQGFLAVVGMKEHSSDLFWRSFSGESIIVGFDGISDPGNAGTMLRTCDWFGIDGVLIDRSGVEIYSPKVMRSAMGSIFHLPILPEVDMLQAVGLARENGFRIFVTTSSGESEFPSGAFPQKSMFIFGNEAHGVTPEILREADARVSIPKFGKAESLNVAIACGVILGTVRLRGSS
jgi:RNA methyltransferase, TrmH family